MGGGRISSAARINTQAKARLIYSADFLNAGIGLPSAINALRINAGASITNDNPMPNAHLHKAELCSATNPRSLHIL